MQCSINFKWLLHAPNIFLVSVFIMQLLSTNKPSRTSGRGDWGLHDENPKISLWSSELKFRRQVKPSLEQQTMAETCFSMSNRKEVQFTPNTVGMIALFRIVVFNTASVGMRYSGIHRTF